MASLFSFVILHWTHKPNKHLAAHIWYRPLLDSSSWDIPCYYSGIAQTSQTEVSLFPSLWHSIQYYQHTKQYPTQMVHADVAVGWLWFQDCLDEDIFWTLKVIIANVVYANRPVQFDGSPVNYCWSLLGEDNESSQSVVLLSALFGGLSVTALTCPCLSEDPSKCISLSVIGSHR
jgi:hypothetical protein